MTSLDLSSNIPSDMRAWSSPQSGRDQLELNRRPLPRLDPGESLVEVEYAGLNFADLLMIDDAYQVRPPRPFVPGQEVAGRIVHSGSESPLRRGQRVASKVVWGAFAEYAVIRDDMAIALPPETSLTQAIALPVIYTTAWMALHQCTKITADDTVLVLGASGGVGLAAVELARIHGCRVVAAASTPDKLEVARSRGADHLVDYSQSEWAARLAESEVGRGINVVFDPVGGRLTRESLMCMNWDARLLIVGFASGEVAKIPAHRLLLRRLCAIGVYWDHDRDAEVLRRAGSELVEHLVQNRLRPLVHDCGKLDALPVALDLLARRRATGKLCLHVSSQTQRGRQS